MPTGFLVLLAISIVCALAAHWRIRSFWMATLVSAPATVAVFLAAASIQAGVPDPIKPIALLYFAGLGWVVSAQVGAVFVLARHRRRQLA